MNKYLAILVFSISLNHVQTQTTINYYSIPYKNVFRTRALELDKDGFILLFNSYCYTPGSLVIDGCPLGYYLYRLDGNQDTTWTRHIELSYPDLPSIYWNKTLGTTKVFGDLGPESGECNGEFIFSSALSGFYWPTVHNFDLSGTFLDSAKFTVDNCFLEYRLARKLPGNHTLLGFQYYERSSQGPVTYAEARYVLLNEKDKIEQEFSYPDKYYFATKWTEVDSTNTLFIHYNITSHLFELIKINEQGNEIWAKPYDGNPVKTIKDIQILRNGDIAVQGSYSDNQFKKNILSRYNPDGNLLWSKEFINTVSFSALGEMENGQLLYGESMWHGTSRDIFLRALSPNGDSLSAKWYPLSPGTDQVWSIIGQADGFYFAGDAFEGLDSVYGPARAFLAFDKIETTATKEKDRSTGLLYSIIPNPATTTVRIESSSTVPIQNAILFDIAGKEIKTLYNSLHHIDISDLPPGFYIIEINGATNNASIQKFLKL